MTDDKKIEEAAINKCGFISSEFYSGAKWMQEEFLKNLWHTDDEIPELGKNIIIKGLKLLNSVGDCELFSSFTNDIDLSDFDKKIQWGNFCKCAGVDFTWCYLEDLSPKGGEK